MGFLKQFSNQVVKIIFRADVIPCLCAMMLVKPLGSQICDLGDSHRVSLSDIVWGL